MGLLGKILRRAVIVAVIILWAPLAKTPSTPREPLSPMQAIVRSGMDEVERRAKAAEAVVATGDRNATLLEHVLLAAVLPGTLVRVPVQLWAEQNRTVLWRRVQGEGLPLCLARTNWFDTIEHRELLLYSSYVCVAGAVLLTFSRRPKAAMFACGLLNASLVFFLVVAVALNSYRPTPQAGFALLGALFETRAAHHEANAEAEAFAAKRAATLAEQPVEATANASSTGSVSSSAAMGAAKASGSGAAGGKKQASSKGKSKGASKKVD